METSDISSRCGVEVNKLGKRDAFLPEYDTYFLMKPIYFDFWQHTTC